MYTTMHMHCIFFTDTIELEHCHNHLQYIIFSSVKLQFASLWAVDVYYEIRDLSFQLAVLCIFSLAMYKTNIFEWQQRWFFISVCSSSFRIRLWVQSVYTMKSQVILVCNLTKQGLQAQMCRLSHWSTWLLEGNEHSIIVKGLSVQ